MPVKNTAKFLPECLDSIINQSFESWELIAVNDHSTDESLEIIKKYAATDSRINILNNSDFGIIPALKLAFDYSNGDFITRMDSDDICKENKLEVLVNSLNLNSKGHIAIGQVEYFSENELGEGYKKYANWLNELTAKGENLNEIYKECVIPSPCWMVHKSDLEKCGAFSNDIYPEDYDLCFRMLQANLKCIPSNKIIHLWRDHSSRSSRTDDNYADNHFMELKVKYFLKLHKDSKKETLIWGAGKKGKKVAELLKQHQVTFRWVCNNENKIGKEISGVILEHESNLNEIDEVQVIVCVANQEEQQEIKHKLHILGLENMKTYFFFC